MEKINWYIPRISGDPINLSLKNGDQLFIVGANGSGKSALIQQCVSRYPHNWVKRITAYRQTWLESGSINFTSANRQEYEQYNNTAYNRFSTVRWKDDRSGSHIAAALFDLVAKENNRARAVTRHIDGQEIEKAKETAAESPSPFNQINELLALGNLTVTIENFKDHYLLARHPQGNAFSIAEMSDGERNAAIIAAQVIAAEPGTLFLIDEPERHLHRSSIQPFLSALFNLRIDCKFIIATHEIALPIANPGARVLILRSCQWNSNQCVAWDAEVLEPGSELPEELKRAILGSRKRILFVEGDSDNSLDLPLYTALFPGISVVPKGSCKEVQKAVVGLRGSVDLHHAEAFGLIDKDDRKGDQIEKLAESGIFALKVYSAESLYYCSDAIAAVAREQASLRGEDETVLIKAAKQEAIEAINEHAERMVARRCERRTRELLLSKMPDWKSIKANPTQQICVFADSPYQEELNCFEKLVKDGDLDQLVARYPVRESGAFKTIARSLKCVSKTDYEQMVITQIRQDDTLAEKLKRRIGPLSEALEQVGSPAPE